jgi:hypothetical protein
MTKEGTEEDELDKIYDYLGLNTISDQRLKLKTLNSLTNGVSMGSFTYLLMY